jgi:hypothetical protein
VLALAILLTFSVVGAVVASRHPRNTIGWMFCTMGLVEGLDTLTRGYAEFWLASGWGPRSLAVTAAWFSSWAWTPLVVVPTTFLLLLFPDGRLPSPRWRPVAWLAGLGISDFILGYALDAGPLGDLPQIRNPYGVDSPVMMVVGVAAALVMVGSMVASAASVIVRLRQAGRVERQQIKWLAYGGAVVVGAIFVGGLIAIWSVTVSIAVTTIALLGVPISTGVAIVRYRLYDIDILINRTLVYGALTAMLALVYFGGVAVTQAIFRSLSGQEQQPQLAVVISTLVIAALFNPLRRDETDLDSLSADLVGVVQETMQPARVSLWLRPDVGTRGIGEVTNRRALVHAGKHTSLESGVYGDNPRGPSHKDLGRS